MYDELEMYKEIIYKRWIFVFFYFFLCRNLIFTLGIGPRPNILACFGSVLLLYFLPFYLFNCSLLVFIYSLFKMFIQIDILHRDFFLFRFEIEFLSTYTFITHLSCLSIQLGLLCAWYNFLFFCFFL